MCASVRPVQCPTSDASPGVRAPTNPYGNYCKSPRLNLFALFALRRPGAFMSCVRACVRVLVLFVSIKTGCRLWICVHGRVGVFAQSTQCTHTGASSLDLEREWRVRVSQCDCLGHAMPVDMQ